MLYYFFVFLLKFIIGAILGSFVVCTEYRIKNKISLYKERSFCNNCKKILSPIDLIPILTPLIWRGKCRHCGYHYGYESMFFELFYGLITIILPPIYAITVIFIISIIYILKK